MHVRTILSLRMQMALCYEYMGMMLYLLMYD